MSKQVAIVSIVDAIREEWPPQEDLQILYGFTLEQAEMWARIRYRDSPEGLRQIINWSRN